MTPIGHKAVADPGSEEKGAYVGFFSLIKVNPGDLLKQNFFQT